MNSSNAQLALGLATLLALGLFACASEPEPELEFETVELGGRPTDSLTPDDDAAEAVRTHGLAAELPASFPNGMPVPASSSVVSTSARSVTFGTEDSAAGVKADLESQLARAGWTTSGSSDSGTDYRNGPQTLSVRFTEEAERTLIRYQY